MATVVNNKKYGKGHQVVLKQATYLSKYLIEQLNKHSYKPGATMFTIADQTHPKKFTPIVIGDGKDKIVMKDKANKVVVFIGSASAINNSFNHYSDAANSNTNLLTEIKENITMWQLEAIIEHNRFLTEDQIIEKLGKNSNFYHTHYNVSALSQCKAFKKEIGSSKGYIYERQGKDQTKKIYEVARKLTGKLNDNWNPADVWMIKKNFNLLAIYNSKNSTELNSLIAKALKEKQLIPISLKQVYADSASVSLVDPSSILKQKLNFDFSLDKVDISESYNNFIVWTKSSFGIRVGFKASSTTLNVSMEGRFANAGSQVGAVDAKEYVKHVKDTHKYTVRGSSTIQKSDHKTAKAELKYLFSKYPRLSNKIKSYKHAIEIYEAGDELIQSRFANLMSYLHSFLETPEKFEEHMKFCYYSAKKVSGDSCAYYLIK